MAEALPCHAGVLDPAASTEVADPRHAVSWHAGSQAGALSARDGGANGWLRLDAARVFTVSGLQQSTHAALTIGISHGDMVSRNLGFSPL